MSGLNGVTNVIDNLNRRIQQIEGAGQRGITRAAQRIRRYSMQNAPIVTGNLRASAYVISGKGNAVAGMGAFPEDPGGEMGTNHSRVLVNGSVRVASKDIPFAEVGFSAVYAWSVHENPRSGQTGGVSPDGRTYKRYSEVGSWKFLEKAMEEHTNELLDIIATDARRGLS